MSAIALVQRLLRFPLIGDVALLVALYTVAVHESRPERHGPRPS